MREYELPRLAGRTPDRRAGAVTGDRHDLWCRVSRQLWPKCPPWTDARPVGPVRRAPCACGAHRAQAVRMAVQFLRIARKRISAPSP